MASVSPPKPWERAGVTTRSALPVGTTSSVSPATAPGASITSPTTILSGATTSTTSNLTAPELPSRPNSLNAVVSRNASNYSPYAASRLGANPYSAYGGYGGYGAYSSPYNRFGSMYGAYSGYGGMYGGMGGMYGGMPADPNDPNSLTNSFNQSTAATFQMIEGIVTAFGGLAQMLESTYVATHSSFFAMVSVAEQFGNLRNTLGSVLGIFAIIRWFRTLVAKLTGRPPPADATSLTPSAFSAFLHGGSAPATLPDGSPAPPRASKKPFIMFLVAVFGLPYLMGKLIRALARSQEEEVQRQQQRLTGPNGEQPGASLDPSKLDFCRVLYDYTPDAHNTTGVDLAVSKGDTVAVLSKSDPMGNPSEWWRCRARDGRVGYLPSPYLEIMKRPSPPQAITTGSSGSAPSSRTATMTSDIQVNDGSTGRTQSMTTVIDQAKVSASVNKADIKEKMGAISVESFQKSSFPFYS